MKSNKEAATAHEEVFMTGIRFVTDAKGKKVAVLIDLATHGALWEDIEYALVSESRRKERSIPYADYKAKRKKRVAQHV